MDAEVRVTFSGGKGGRWSQVVSDAGGGVEASDQEVTGETPPNSHLSSRTKNWQHLV